MATSTLSPEELAVKVKQVREKFSAKYNGSILDDTYETADVKWFKTCDGFVRCALRSFKCQGNVDKTVDLINDILLFRAKWKLSSLKETDLDPELVKLNALFFHGVDKQGHKVLYFRLSAVKKGQFPHDTQRRAIAFVMNQHYMVTPEEPVVTCFDCTDAGLGQMDTELSQFVIMCNSIYFPQLVAYGLMFKMPKTLEVVYAIIKGFMNKEQTENTHVVSRKDVQKYIAEDQLLPHMIKAEKK